MWRNQSVLFLLITSKSVELLKRLQVAHFQHLILIVNVILIRLIELNVSKIRVICLTEKINVLNYLHNLGNVLRLWSDCIKDMGSHIDSKLRSYYRVDFPFFHSSPSIIRMIKSRRMRWAEHVARMGEKRNAYRVLVGKSEGKRPLGRRSCVDNIKLILKR
jgi:hypothetical protein